MASLANKLAANKRFDFKSDGFDADKFAVVNMTGYEAISKPFRFVLTLVSDDADIEFDDVLQASATLQIFAPDGASSTPYHGVLAEFDQMHQADGYVFYRAVLVPRLWHLSLYQMSEVYLNEQTIPQILEQVLKSSRLVGSDYAMKLAGSYRERSFVCQYQETHLDFLSRWMEKEGMYFYFEHDGPTDKLVVVDRLSMHPAEAVKVFYRPVNEQDTGSAPDSVQDFVCRQKPLPKQLVLRDFNHRKASVELKVTETVSANGIGEVNLYGENFRNEAEGQRYAKLRAEEIRCGARVFTGDATAVGLRSGYFMELARHYRENFNGKYLVTEVQHEGSQAAALLAGIKTDYGDGKGETIYRSTFRAIPADVQFRQERTTQRPRVSGTMNATIDAAGLSPYAELDEYGQYKVQLPFDSSDKAAGKGSARVRMASPYSGSDHGMNFPLHKNAEVLLSFIDGNPDEPVILGAVPNSENVSIVNQLNPYQNKITTAGGNVMHMGDQKGKEVMWMHSPFHNSTIGIGSVDPKGGGSLWTSTKGSSESVTFGMTNKIAFGASYSATLGFDNTLSVALTNKAALGVSMGVNLGLDVAVKAAMAVTVSKGSDEKFAADGSVKGSEEVVISGGQRPLIKAPLELAQTVALAATGVGLAVNAVLAGLAAKKISQACDANGAGPWDHGKNINEARAYVSAGAAATLAAIGVTLVAVGWANKKIGIDKSYASNIKLNASGIRLSCDTVIPLKKSIINVKNESFAISTGTSLPDSDTVLFPKSEISGNSWTITLGVTAVPGVTNQLFISNAQAKLAMVNPDGVLTLVHELGGSFKLAPTGLTAQAGESKLAMTTTFGSSLSCVGSKVAVNPSEISIASDGSSIAVSAEGLLLKDLSGSKVSIDVSGIAVNGVLVRLG